LKKFFIAFFPSQCLVKKPNVKKHGKKHQKPPAPIYVNTYGDSGSARPPVTKRTASALTISLASAAQALKHLRLCERTTTAQAKLPMFFGLGQSAYTNGATFTFYQNNRLNQQMKSKKATLESKKLQINALR